MNIWKRITACTTALLIAVNPLQQSFTVSADDIRDDVDFPFEDTLLWDDQDNGKPDFAENDDEDTPETFPEHLQDETEMPKISETEIIEDNSADKIITAVSSDEYFDLISCFPDCEKIIIDTYAELSFQGVLYGVYFDGTYIVGFENDECLYKAVEMLSKEGIEYSVDGTLTVCGDGYVSVDDVSVNPAAKIRVAVIDTGSNLASEAYSVIGDDVSDHNGHGTSMCDAILGETDDAYIISIKAIGDDGRGSLSDVYVAVQLAEEMNVDYILMAVSVRNTGNYDAFISLVKNTKAQVVASAGNNGTEASKYLPAGIPGVITVGALNEDGTLRSTSNYGDFVDYYVIAGSTSDAASRALGMIIDGRKDELAAEYKDVSETEDLSGSTAELIERTEDEDVFTVNRKGQSSVTIQRVSWFYQSDYFTAPVAANAEFGVYSDEPDNSNGSFHWDSDYILYCIENTKDWPDGITYSGNSSTNNMLAVAAAAGPDGALYSYAVAWWKANGSSEITSALKNTGANTLDWKRTMYCITHFTMDRIYTGSWSSSAPRNNNSVWTNYYNWLSGLNGGSALSDGKMIRNGSRWCEIYSYTDSNYQKMARGGVSLTVPEPMSFTVDKSSTVTVDPGFFSFEGTTYTLYGDFSPVLDPQTMEPGDYQLGNALKTFAIGADGTSETTYSAAITSGRTYYLKETAAALGFETDDTIYWINLSAGRTISSGVMESYISGGRTLWRQADGSAKITVTDGPVSVIHLKDAPKAGFNLTKKLGTNYSTLAGQTYSFELWDNTANVKVANGIAAVSSGATNASSTPVVWSGITSGYESASNNRLILIPGHSYQVMETTLAVNGAVLETPSGWIKGNAHGRECFHKTFTPGAGSVNALDITNNSPAAFISASKTLGANYQFLRNRTYTFELWDNTTNTQVASGAAVFDSSATNTTVAFVSWSNLNTAGGYGSASDNKVRVIAGHEYQIMETITVVDGRTLETPSGWTKGTAHGKNCFYKTAELNSGADTVFTITNDTKVSLSLTKGSADAAKTDGNSAYNFEGTTYVLANDTAFSSANTVGTIVMNANGTAKSSLNVVCGSTYYLKETKAGTGYKLDTAVYKIVVNANGTATVSVQAGTSPAAPTVTNSYNGSPILINLKDMPENVSISLSKTSAAPSVTDNNSCYSLKGTSYGLYSSLADADSNANRLTAFTVNADGITTTMYSSAYGKTYYLKEIAAGNGYNLDSTVYTVTVSAAGDVNISNINGATVTKSGNTCFLNVKDTPGNVPFDISVRKVDKNGNIVHNADLSGAKFRISYYAQDLGASDNNDAAATVICEYTLSGDSAKLKLSDLQALTPVGGSAPNYLKDLPSNINGFPFGTIRIQENDAPAGYMLNDQVVRYRLTTSGTVCSVEGVSSYGNRNYWKQLSDGTMELTELPKVGYYSLTKSLEDTAIRSSLAGFEYELYNTSSKTYPVLIATGISQADGKVLWTYKTADYYSNTDDSKRLTDTTAYNLELPATEKNSAGAEVAIHYQVRERKSSIDIAYGASGIPYTYSAPVTEGTAWNNSSDYFFKAVTVNNSNAVKQDSVVNNYEYTGLSVNKVVPSGNPFNMTKVAFRLYNADSNKLIANGLVDSNGNVTWNRVDASGFGTTTGTSVNVINFLPLGHYRVEETWDKEYVDAYGTSVLIGEKNNSGWKKTETDTSYTYSFDADLSDVSNDGKIFALSVENEREVQEFNLVKNVSVEGDASKVTAELYLINGDKEILVAAGIAETVGKGTFGFTWDYGGEHVVRDGLDTLVLPAGKYRIAETCPVTYYNETDIPYTYMTPEGYTARTVGGDLQFYKDFELKSGEYATEKMSITNVRIEGSFEIIKIERSGDGSAKDFTFGVYYRGNGDTASDTAVLIETVKITTDDGRGSAALTKLPEGWYEMREISAGPEWETHWLNDVSVSNGNKLIRLDSGNGSKAVLTVDDGIRENGNAINAVVIYNDAKPEIRTTLTDDATGDHVVSFSDEATLTDTVSYTNLRPGHYVITGVLVDKNTGKELTDIDGNIITGSKSFDVFAVLDEFGETKPQAGNVKVTYVVDTTLINDVAVVAFEELHRTSGTGDLIASHKDTNDAAQTVYIPEIRTSLKDAETDSHVASYSETATLTDTVSYSNLMPGKEYTLYGELMERTTGKSLGITAVKTFTPASSSGTVTVTFTVDTESIKGTAAVAFERLKYDDIDIAVHADINDENQTVGIPEIRTENTDKNTEDDVVGYDTLETLVDTVSYTNLVAGKTYEVTGTLMDKETGESLGITGSTVFVAESSEGTVDVTFTFDSTVLSGRTIVAFETLKYEGRDIAVHADINDEDQTVFVPEIGTTFVDPVTDDHVASCSGKIKLIDTVSYVNFVAGKEYTLTGTLMDKKTGKELKDNDGNVYTVSKIFTPEKESGTIDVEFEIDTAKINGVAVVAFEKLYHNDVLVAVHADINDVDQTVYIPEIRTKLNDVVSSDHVASEETVTLIDTVRYSGLFPGKDYTVKGILVNKETGEKILDEKGDPITGTANFTPEEPEGTVEIVFEFSSGLLRGSTVVAFEELYYRDIKVAVHADIDDEDQTVYFPEIHTTMTDMTTNEHVSAQGGTIRLIDTVSYKDLKPGLKYLMNGTLYVRSTEDVLTDADGKPVTATAEFTPDSGTGFVELVFEFDSLLLKGESLVAFEELTFKETVVATHNDINDRNQTVDIPDIHTTFFDAAFGPEEDLARCEKKVELTDRVYYKNLTPDLEYRLYLTVMVQDTGEPLLDKDGKPVTAEKTFVPETSEGYVDVSVTVDATLCEGRSLVAFESLDHENINLVIHADIEDKEQTVNIPEIRTTATDADNKTHTLTYTEKVTIEDAVAYENLVPGKTYKITGTLYNKETGEVYKDEKGNVYKAEKEFAPASSSGVEIVTFKDVVVPFEKIELVAFEELSEKVTGIRLAVHSDLTDEDQTVRRPWVSTTATILNSKEIWLESTDVVNITVSDHIYYGGFEPGRTYRAEATLYKTDGTQIRSAGQPILSIVEFVPPETDGEVVVNTTFSSEGLAEGDRIVVFEKFYDVATKEEIGAGIRTSDILISRHEDLANDSQTVTVHYRPMTGGIVPSYSAAGTVIASVATAIAFVWFVVSRKKTEDGN